MGDSYAKFMHFCIPNSDPDFVDLIQHRFHREKIPGILADIYDGSAYMKFSEFLSTDIISLLH